MAIEKKSEQPLLFQFLNAISDNKEDLLSSVEEKEYNAFMVNRFLSFDASTCLYAQEMNERYFLPAALQFDYLRYAVRRKRRFFKYLKKDKEDNLAIIKEYFGYSSAKAMQVIDLLDPYDIEHIKKCLEKGGQKGGTKTAKA